MSLYRGTLDLELVREFASCANCGRTDLTVDEVNYGHDC
jgi:hypothetical protein